MELAEDSNAKKLQICSLTQSNEQLQLQLEQEKPRLEQERKLNSIRGKIVEAKEELDRAQREGEEIGKEVEKDKVHRENE